nr:MAG TPA: hypothetical protein [Caudoviricetes sp.]
MFHPYRFNSFYFPQLILDIFLIFEYYLHKI